MQTKGMKRLILESGVVIAFDGQLVTFQDGTTEKWTEELKAEARLQLEQARMLCQQYGPDMIPDILLEYDSLLRGQELETDFHRRYYPIKKTNRDDVWKVQLYGWEIAQQNPEFEIL